MIPASVHTMPKHSGFCMQNKKPFDIDKAISEATTSKNLTELARKMGMGRPMLMYNLGKHRRLELVQAIIWGDDYEYKKKKSELTKSLNTHINLTGY